MADGRSRLEWSQTSLVACLVASGKGVHCTPDDFNPYATGRTEEPLGMSEFKAMFAGSKKKTVRPETVRPDSEVRSDGPTVPQEPTPSAT